MYTHMAPEPTSIHPWSQGMHPHMAPNHASIHQWSQGMHPHMSPEHASIHPWSQGMHQHMAPEPASIHGNPACIHVPICGSKAHGMPYAIEMWMSCRIRCRPLATSSWPHRTSLAPFPPLSLGFVLPLLPSLPLPFLSSLPRHVSSNSAFCPAVASQLANTYVQ
jgi:hypothetical protein